MGKRSGLWVGVHIWQDMCSLHTDYCHLFHVLSLFDFICLLSVGLRFNAMYRFTTISVRNNHMSYVGQNLWCA